MKVLALDISTSAGWAVLTKSEGGPIAVEARGRIVKEKTAVEYGPYPRSYRLAAQYIANRLLALVLEHNPDAIVIEETNTSRNRYSQKLLEWIHLYFQMAWDTDPAFAGRPEPVYISSGVWRSTLELRFTNEDRRNNAKLKRARDRAQSTGQSLNDLKKELGIRGKVDRKVPALRYVEATYGIKFKKKDNDIAEAITLGTAYFLGAPHCNGE